MPSAEEIEEYARGGLVSAGMFYLPEDADLCAIPAEVAKKLEAEFQAALLKEMITPIKSIGIPTGCFQIDYSHLIAELKEEND